MSSNNILPLFAEVQPYHHDYLKVSEMHRLYFEQCGNPNGIPVIFLHGGPGSGCNPTQRRFFDPKHYRIVLFDQRGCGRSLPEGEIEENNTEQLVGDIEKLRLHLKIDRWHVFGGSWGSTLALAYAIFSPQNVLSLTLRGIFLSRPDEIQWFLHEVRQFFPEPWEKLCAYLPPEKRNDVLSAYEALIFSQDESVSIPAAIAWNAYESNIMSLLPKTSATEVNGKVELARARVQIHYIKHLCFVGHRNLLNEAAKTLGKIPTVIIQGRYDMVCPPISAWELSKALPHASYEVIADAGHSAMEPNITSALIHATEKFKAII